MRGTIPPRACFANGTSEGDRIEMSGVQIPDFLKDTAGEWWVRPLTSSSSGNKKGFTRVIPLVLYKGE